MLLAIILVLGAAWSFFIAAKPEVGFFLEEGWKFRDAEPSDLYLGVTRFGAAIGGIGCLVFAAILAFGGPDGSRSNTTDGGRPDGSAEESLDPAEKVEEESQRAREECERVKPKFEDTAKWSNQHKLTNPDDVQALGTSESVIVEIDSREAGDWITVKSGIGGSPRILFTIGASGGVCVP